MRVTMTGSSSGSLRHGELYRLNPLFDQAKPYGLSLSARVFKRLPLGITVPNLLSPTDYG